MVRHVLTVAECHKKSVYERTSGKKNHKLFVNSREDNEVQHCAKEDHPSNAACTNCPSFFFTRKTRFVSLDQS